MSDNTPVMPCVRPRRKPFARSIRDMGPIPREAANTLVVTEPQPIVHLLVKEIRVGKDAIIIPRSVPITSPPHDGESRQSCHSNGKVIFCG
jgi:hypothetical protein